MKIEVRRPAEGELDELGVSSWPTWECEPSTFPWHYDERETCYLLAGRVTVETPRETVSFAAGDLVVLPEGLDCTWTVSQAVRKHYRFG